MTTLARVTRTSVGKLKDLIDISTTPYVECELDETVERVELVAPNNSITVIVYSLGATVSNIILKNGQEVTFIEDSNWFKLKKGYNGRTCGRLSGRTGSYSTSSRITNEEEMFSSNFNDKDMSQVLHGGNVGFSFRNWKLVNTFISQKSARAVFELDSQHMDQGHPGSIRVEAHVMAIGGVGGVGEKNDLTPPRFDIRYRARLRRDSPCHALVNLTSHCYFNLGENQQLTALQHELHLPNGKQVFPEHFVTESIEVKDQFDFQVKKLVQAPLDHCFVIESDEGEKTIAAELYSPSVKMTVYTSCPSVVVYTAQHAENKGICLEFQYPPNCANMTKYLPKVKLIGHATLPNDFQRLHTRLSPRRTLSFIMSASSLNEYEYDEITMHAFTLLK